MWTQTVGRFIENILSWCMWLSLPFSFLKKAFVYFFMLVFNNEVQLITNFVLWLTFLSIFCLPQNHGHILLYFLLQSFFFNLHVNVYNPFEFTLVLYQVSVKVHIFYVLYTDDIFLETY